MPILLRVDVDAAHLRRAARASGNADQGRRLLALAAIYDGASRTEAAATVALIEVAEVEVVLVRPPRPARCSGGQEVSFYYVEDNRFDGIPAGDDRLITLSVNDVNEAGP